uniref:hypothetical protein n=1 Tax=Thiolapillus sp. TaxID=2017437 RepID=UPI0025D587C0
MFSLWRKARRENSAASRLLGTTSLRFALHGWQRTFPKFIPFSIHAAVPERLRLSARHQSAVDLAQMSQDTSPD